MSDCELSITKSLGLLDSKGDYLNPMSHKLILYAISKVNPKEPLPKEVKITAYEFAQALELPMQHAYDHIYNALEKLWNAEINWSEKDWEGSTRWIQKKGTKTKGEGAISFTWSDDVHKGLVNLRNGFKSYQLRNIAKLETSHAIRLYEVLMRYKDTGVRIIKVEDLKAMLGIPDKYPRYADFNRFVILPTVKHINDKSNIRVTKIDTEKKGRKITHFKIHFKLENQMKLNLGDNVKASKKKASQPHTGLDDKAKELVAKYGKST